MRTYRSHEDYLNDRLKDPKEAALYLNAAAEEGDPSLILAALAQVARAHGVSTMAKRVSLSRMGLYKTLSKKGNPEFKTFLGILRASGLRMSFKPGIGTICAIASGKGRFSGRDQDSVLYSEKK